MDKTNVAVGALPARQSLNVRLPLRSPQRKKKNEPFFQRATYPKHTPSTFLKAEQKRDSPSAAGRSGLASVDKSVQR
jgi:hypothetical protein